MTPEAAEPEGDKVDLRGFFGILGQRWLAIAVPTALALVLGLAYVATATRIYTGVTSLLIDTRTRSAVGDPNSGVDNSPDAVLVESQVRLISSDAVLRRVVDAEGLANDPEFASTTPGLRTRLFQALGLAKSSTATDRTAQATLSLASHVVVNRSERTYIADIEVTSSDPIKAAHLADAVAQAYLADQQATRNDAAERDSDWVRGQILQMQAGLQDAELKAEAYKREHGIIGTNGKLLNEQELADASANLSAATSRATEVKARLDQIKNITAAGRNLDALPDALKSPLIDKLRGQYADLSRQQATLRQTLGDRHPALLESEQQLRDLRRLILEELARIQGGIANEYQTAQSNVTASQKHVEVLKAAAIVSNGDRVRLDELQRDVDARRAVYDRFLRARDTVREQAVDAPMGRVIAPARIPIAPSSPKTFAILALSLAAGLGLGVAAALGADLLVGRPRERAIALKPGERAAALQPVRTDVPLLAPATGPREIPVLGYVPSPFGNPAALANRSWLADRFRTAWPTAMEIEHVPSLPAFRSAIQALGLLDRGSDEQGKTPRSLAVTSAAASDSRTTLALGLAEAAAAQGLRAVVIDADEKGSLLRDLVTAEARPSLIDLMGTTRICYRIVAPFRGSLSIVPIVSTEAQTARRLMSRGSSTSLDGIASHFDLVVFDGPALSEIDRIEAIAATVDTVIVAAPKTSTQDSIDRAVGSLDLAMDTSIAAVLVADLAEGAAASEAA